MEHSKSLTSQTATLQVKQWANETERMRPFRVRFKDQNRLNVDAKDRLAEPHFPDFTSRQLPGHLSTMRQNLPLLPPVLPTPPRRWG
jgi:hypothetical protein